MGDFPTISLLASILILVPFYVVVKTWPKVGWLAFAIAMLALSIFGWLETTGDASQPIFAAIMFLSFWGVGIAGYFTGVDWISEQLQNAFDRLRSGG